MQGRRHHQAKVGEGSISQQGREDCLARSMPRDGCPPPGHAPYPHQVIAWSISHLGMPCQDIAGISQLLTALIQGDIADMHIPSSNGADPWLQLLYMGGTSMSRSDASTCTGAYETD